MKQIFPSSCIETISNLRENPFNFSIREIRNEERSVVPGSRASLGWLQPVSGLSRPVSLRQRRAGGVGGRPAAENRVQRWKKRRSWLEGVRVASSSRETMERNRTKKDTKKRAKLETRALRKVGGNRSRTSFSFDHRRIRPAICYRTIRTTIFFPSSFLLDDPRAAILFIPAYPFDGTRNFYLSSWSFPTFLERFILGFSFLRNRNTWNVIIAIQENDTGIISQRNCFERIELKKIEEDYL